MLHPVARDFRNPNQPDDAPLHRLSRLFLIYNILSMGGRVTGRDLAAACRCSTKTIRRDLDALEELGALCPWKAAKNSYVLEQPLPCHAVELSLAEILSLAMLRALAPVRAGMPYEAQAGTAFDKLASRLPSSLREELATLRAVMNGGVEARHDYVQAPVQELVEAARSRHTLQMTYYSISRDAVSIRDVDPYSLVLQNGYFSLVGFCHQRQAPLLFALDNIRTLSATGRSFEKQRDFSLAQFMEGSLNMMRGEPVEIVVRFEASHARWARRFRWGFPHTLTPEADGAVLLRGKVSGLQGIRNELLRWGAGVRVLEPPQLCEEMRREAAAMLAHYAAEIAEKPEQK